MTETRSGARTVTLRTSQRPYRVAMRPRLWWRLALPLWPAWLALEAVAGFLLDAEPVPLVRARSRLVRR